MQIWKTFLRGLLVASVPATFLGACASAGELVESEPVGSKTQALTACTNASLQCAPNEGCCGGFCRPIATKNSTSPRLVAMSGSTLSYACYANEPSASIPTPSARHVVPDFSRAGYRGGGVKLPDVAGCGPVIQPSSDPGVNLQKINSALHRGTGYASCPTPYAVRLAKGTFKVNGTILIELDGTVLRGAGQGGPNKTLVQSVAGSPNTLIFLSNPSGTLPVEVGTKVPITGGVAVGSNRIQTGSTTALSVGTTIAVVRTPNKAWVTDIGMVNPFVNPEWKPKDFVVSHYRTITAVTPNFLGTQFTLDYGMVESIDLPYGGGTDASGVGDSPGYLVAVSGPAGSEMGLEDMALDTLEPDPQGFDGVRLGRVKNSWVRRLTVTRFGRSAVHLVNNSDFNTVEEVAHLDPVSPIKSNGLPIAGTRYSFWISGGAFNLFQRCYTYDSRHSFVTTERVAGPNVWLDSLSENANADEGPHLYWATGLLYDNIKAVPSAAGVAEYGPHAGGVRVYNADDGGTSHGWTGAQMMIWNSQDSVVSDAPPAAMNWVVGGVAVQAPPDPSSAQGISHLTSTVVTPRSLYLQQLKERVTTTAFNSVTSVGQRGGRIWEALHNWGAALRAGTGSGALDDYQPDPQCGRGIAGGRICCALSCDANCGGGHCSDGGTENCCTGAILAADRSCAHFPPPCVMPDPNCDRGLKSGSVCCADSRFCSACGTSNCNVAPNSADNCCTNNIVNAQRSCLEYPAPCVMADPNCVAGTPGDGTCCSNSSQCSQCGGADCSLAPNTPGNCCVGDIAASGNSCTTHYAPCAR